LEYSVVRILRVIFKGKAPANQIPCPEPSCPGLLSVIGGSYAKNWHAIIFLFLIFSRAWAASLETPMSGYEERRRATAALMEAATVWIVAEDDDCISSGSGFLVGKGRVITNAHVVEGVGKRGSVYVLNEKIPITEARVLKAVHDETDDDVLGGRDFALLKFTPPSGVDLPTLAFNLEVKRMDRVSAWGYPVMVTRFDKSTRALRDDGDASGLEPAPVVYTEGAVSAIVSERMGSAIVHTAAIAGGNSGGPLVNGRGEVVGINTWGYKEEDEGAFLNISIMANDIVAFLLDNGIEPILADGQKFTALPPSSPAPPGPGKPDKPNKPKKIVQGSPSRENRVRDVGRFTVKVPVEWSVLDEEDDMILLGSDDEAAAVGILVASNDGMSIRAVARAYAEEFGGSKPVGDDDGVYTFSFEDDDVETVVFVGEGNEDDTHVMIFISGDGSASGVEEILDSVEDK
jgi:V8-like Glu-specific endopeptidase